jgi:hypothetical protein
MEDGGLADNVKPALAGALGRFGSLPFIFGRVQKEPAPAQPVENIIRLVRLLALRQDVVDLPESAGRWLPQQMLEFSILREHGLDHGVNQGALYVRLQRAQAYLKNGGFVG